jgi:glycosyltransferase involved in cell wall biosynthesis
MKEAGRRNGRQRLLFLAPTDSIHTVRWVSWFAARGHTVEVISFPNNTTLGDDIRVHHLKTPALPGPSSVRWTVQALSHWGQVAGLARRFRPDVVHAHWLVPFGVLAGSLRPWFPVVLTPWGSDLLVLPKEKRRHAASIRAAARMASLITVDGAHLAQAMVQMGARPTVIRTVYFGTDTEQFVPADKEGARRALGLPPSGPVVISTRSLRPIYALDTLLRAAPLVLARHPDAVFLVAGAGPLDAELRAIAAHLGIAASVRFTGALTPAGMVAHLQAADIYVSTSLSDGGLAASTAEAMSCGLPAVVTRFGENDMWVPDGEGGLLFPLHDHAMLASHLLELIPRKDLCARWGERNRRVIESRNSYSGEMSRMEQMYMRLARRETP